MEVIEQIWDWLLSLTLGDYADMLRATCAAAFILVLMIFLAYFIVWLIRKLEELIPGIIGVVIMLVILGAILSCLFIFVAPVVGWQTPYWLEAISVTWCEGLPIPELESDCLPDMVYVADVTIPDRTRLTPGESFVKTWRIRSNGCAQWPAGTNLVFVSGDQMGGPNRVQVPIILLNDTVEVSVPLVAPIEPGRYRGYWQLQTTEGIFFGNRIYVEILVR